MPLSLKESQAVAGLAEAYSSFLPSTPHLYCNRVGRDGECALQMFCRHAVGVGRNSPGRPEPDAERQVGAAHDRAGGD